MRARWSQRVLVVVAAVAGSVTMLNAAGMLAAAVGIGVLVALLTSSPSSGEAPGYELEIGTVR